MLSNKTKIPKMGFKNIILDFFKTKKRSKTNQKDCINFFRRKKVLQQPSVGEGKSIYNTQNKLTNTTDTDN